MEWAVDVDADLDTDTDVVFKYPAQEGGELASIRNDEEWQFVKGWWIFEKIVIIIII